MIELKKGTLLTAIDPCNMDGDENHPTLTIGKEYEVEELNSSRKMIVITDDEADLHYFIFNEIVIYFDAKGMFIKIGKEIITL
jgi:hypothetical protein